MHLEKVRNTHTVTHLNNTLVHVLLLNHNHICICISAHVPVPSFRRQTEGSSPLDEQKPIINSKILQLLLCHVLLALECSITHRMSPLPGWWCHATKCHSRSSSVTHVCLQCVEKYAQVCDVCLWQCSGCVWLCLCALLLWGREPRHTLKVPNVPSLWGCLSAECIIYFSLWFAGSLSSITNLVARW